MPAGLIDTATLAQVVQCFDRGLAQLYPWSQQVVVDLTALLIRADEMALAPGLAPAKRTVRDDQEFLMDIMLSNRLVTTLSSHGKHTLATAWQKSIQWIRRPENIGAVRSETDTFLTDERNFLRWIDWVVEKAWLPHAARLDGLFDRKYLTYVAKVLDISEEDTEDLHNRSKDPAEIKRLAEQRGEDFRYMTKAFIASAIMRGAYHWEIARGRGIHIMQHPLREIVWNRRRSRQPTEIIVPPVVHYLAGFVLCGAMKQASTRDRLRCWVENTANVRSYLSTSAFLPRVRATGQRVLDDAWKTAVAANVQVIDARVEEYVELLVGVGVGILTAIYISPWISIPVAVATKKAYKRLDWRSPANTLARFIQEHRLKESAAGWIVPKWTMDQR